MAKIGIHFGDQEVYRDQEEDYRNYKRSTETRRRTTETWKRSTETWRPLSCRTSQRHRATKQEVDTDPESSDRIITACIIKLIIHRSVHTLTLHCSSL